MTSIPYFPFFNKSVLPQNWGKRLVPQTPSEGLDCRLEEALIVLGMLANALLIDTRVLGFKQA